MEKLTLARLAGYAAAVVLVAVALSFVVNSCSSKKQEKKIQALERRTYKIINADSLRDVIESRILDSLKIVADRQDAKIAELPKSLTVTRRKNEQLEKRINDIIVFMPDF